MLAGGSSLSAFGVDLETHLNDQQQKLGTDAVPYVLSGADAFLRAASLATPGLFRQDVEAGELAALRGRVEAAYASRKRLELAVEPREVNPPLLRPPPRSRSARPSATA